MIVRINGVPLASPSEITYNVQAFGLTNPFAGLGDKLDQLNPFSDMGDKIDRLNSSIENFVYWLNPANWVREAWGSLGDAFSSGALDVPLMAGTIVGIWLIMFGADWPKKWVFWGWLSFWTLRGFVFA